MNIKLKSSSKNEFDTCIRYFTFRMNFQKLISSTGSDNLTQLLKLTDFLCKVSNSTNKINNLGLFAVFLLLKVPTFHILHM